MIVEIKDLEIEKVLRKVANDYAQKQVGATIRGLNVVGRLNEAVNTRVQCDYNKIMADGRLYKAIANAVAEKISNEVLERLDYESITSQVVENISKNLTFSLAAR